VMLATATFEIELFTSAVKVEVAVTVVNWVRTVVFVINLISGIVVVAVFTVMKLLVIAVVLVVSPRDEDLVLPTI